MQSTGASNSGHGHSMYVSEKFKEDNEQTLKLNETLHEKNKILTDNYNELVQEYNKMAEKYELKIKDLESKLTILRTKKECPCCRYKSEELSQRNDSHPSNTRDTIRVPGALSNVDERCYMNSIMQALASSNKVIQQLHRLSESFPTNIRLSRLKELLEVINNASRKREDADNISEIMTQFIIGMQWNRTSQQDAIQALFFFINAIHKEIGTDIYMPPKMKILHTLAKNKTYNKVQDHLMLPLPLCGSFRDLPGAPLKDLLDAFFEPSFIDDSQDTTTMYLFDNAPEVMIVQIQANELSNDQSTVIKPRYYINYGQKLEHTFNIQKDINESRWEIVTVKYNLVAVVEHMGDVHGGHYVTYRRCEDRWYLTNDTQVQEVTFTCDIVPYIMVYEKVREWRSVENQ